MAVIQLPSGVEFDTEDMDADKVGAVLQQLQENQPELFKEPQQRTLPELNLATASKEEIENFARLREEAGLNPLTGQPLKPGETTSLKEVGVDYRTGLQDFGLRAGFSARELPEEKEAYLKDKIGEGGFRQDKAGRFIITKEGRETLGLGEGKEFAIDEEGITRYDVADFGGEVGVPLSAGIGAGLLLSGTGFLVATPLVGASMGLAKLLDEAYETSLGYQRQSQDEIRKDAIKEAILGGSGELLGRFVSSVFGRLIKGPGGKEAEAARTQGRELLKANFTPTIEGAAPNVRPVLARLQAIYEGIFPNQKAANTNLNLIVEELDKLKVASPEALQSLQSVVRSDIEQLFKTSDEIVKDAQKTLDTTIDAEIKAIIEPLRRGEKLSNEAVSSLLNAKALFDEQADSLFTRATKALGQNNKIIPIYEINKTINKIARTSPEADQIRSSELSSIVNKAINEVLNFSPSLRARLAAANRVQDAETRRRLIEEITEEASRLAYITPQDGHILRQIVRNLGYSDEFKATVATGNQQQLKRSIDDSFDIAEKKLTLALAHSDSVRPRGQPGELTVPEQQEILSMLGQSGMSFEGGLSRANIEQLRSGLNLLSRSRKHYEAGMNRFSEPVTEKLYKETGAGTRVLDETRLLDLVVNRDSPEQLLRFFRSVRGAPQISGLEAGESTLERSLIKSPVTGERLTLAQARDYASKLPESKSKRSFVKQIQKEEARQQKLSDARGQGAQAQENMRQALINAWVQRELADPSNYHVEKGVRRLVGARLADRIDELGKTKNVLFKNELPEINRLTTLLRQTGAEFDEDVLSQFGTDNIATSIRKLSEETARRKSFDQNSFLNALTNNDAEGIVSTVFQRGNAERVRQFMSGTYKTGKRDELGKLVETEISQASKNAVQDAAMARILRSLGDTQSTAFRESFVSGRMGSNLQRTLNGYGRETMEAMFGKEVSDGLFQLADNMIAVSNAPMAGKGGLAAPTIAVGLGIFSMLTAPLATLPVALGYLAMSKALRKPAVLKILLASRRPGEDALAQALQVMDTSIAKTILEVSESEEGVTKVSPEIQQSINQATQNIGNLAQTATQIAPKVMTQIPQITSPTAGTASQVSPILLGNNPATQQLAQSLGRSR